MASKKDLVEAHSFSRRRLVTAFVSGAPGGREVEPARPGRVLVGGIALTVLLLAGAAVAGVFTKKTPENWAKEGLYISKENGGRYVITEKSDPAIVRPVINITSAMLILGADAKPTVVSQKAIQGETAGEEIGILGAPEIPPAIDRLIPSGWTACSDTDAGVKLNVATKPDVTRAPETSAAVVQVGTGAGADYYLLAQASSLSSDVPGTYAYRLPSRGSDRDNMLRKLQLPTATATQVDAAFLALFPMGGTLDVASMGLRDRGKPVAYNTPKSGLPAGARIGDIVRLPGGQFLVLTATGPADLDPFAAAIYSTLKPGTAPQMSRDLGMSTVPKPYLDANWPDALLRPLRGEVCGELQSTAGARPRVELVSTPGASASAATVAAGTRSVSVEPGRGAFVLSGDWSDLDRGSPFIVDATGQAYPLVGGNAVELLGYASYDVPVVPDSWMELFSQGVSLSQAKALCPPAATEDAQCE